MGKSGVILEPGLVLVPEVRGNTGVLPAPPSPSLFALPYPCWGIAKTYPSSDKRKRNRRTLSQPNWGIALPYPWGGFGLSSLHSAHPLIGMAGLLN